MIDKRLAVTLRRNVRDDLTVTLKMEQPVQAPIEAGQTLGTVRVEAPKLKPVEAPVMAAESVEKLGPMGRVTAALQYLVFGEAQ